MINWRAKIINAPKLGDLGEWMNLVWKIGGIRFKKNICH